MAQKDSSRPYDILDSDLPHAQVQVTVTEAADIRYLLAKQGKTLTDLATEIGVVQSNFSKVLAARGVSERVEKKLAEETGLSLEQVQRVTRKPRAQAGFPG